MGKLFWFLLGAAAALVVYAASNWVAIWVAARRTRRAAEDHLASVGHGEKSRRAFELASACKKRLRFQPAINPAWIEPLKTEIPVLVKGIAEIYYPDAPAPLLAPKASHFSKAVELAARDISQYLTNRRFGRLIDISAHQAKNIHRRVDTLAKKKPVRWMSKVWGRVRPVYQAVKYKSPVTWATVSARNAAVRFLQPAIVDIVAFRAIQLYSGVFETADSHDMKAGEG